MTVELGRDVESAVEEIARERGFASVDQFVTEVLRQALRLGQRPVEAPAERPLWEVLSTSMLDADETLPSDGAREHDHYIYRTPKRSR